MAIKINVKVTFSQDKFLEKLGMKPEYISLLKNEGIALSPVPHGNLEMVSALEGAIVLSIATVDALQVQTGKAMSLTVIGEMRVAITNGMAHFISGFDLLPEDVFEPLPVSLFDTLENTLMSKNLKGALDLLPKGKNIKDVKAEIEADKMHAEAAGQTITTIGHLEGKTIAYAPPTAYPECTDEEIKSAPAVQLRYAKRLYQPVKGTSANSRYFMIAAKPGLRVAARWSKKSGQLSVRVEGDDLNAHKTHLKDIGMDIKGDYASLHINVNPILAKKTVGSLLLALGDLETGIPNIEKVVQ